MLALAALAAIAATHAAIAADAYPSRAITMVIPFSAGGPTDIVGRVMAERMGQILGAQFVVENVVGAGGMTGGARVARAAPDGYQVFVGTVGTHAQNQSLYAKPQYNAVEDFAPVALIAEVPLVLVARNDLPASDLPGFIAYAKTNQKAMNFASSGAGAAVHLGCLMLNIAMGVEVAHVAYRGSAPALNDIVGGRIDYMCEVISTIGEQVKGGNLKAIALLHDHRSPTLPDLKTADEQGLKGFSAYTWNALFLPKGTPDEIVAKLNAAAVAAISDPVTRKRLEDLGYAVARPERATPAYLGQFVRDEIKKWEGPIKASGVRVE